MCVCFCCYYQLFDSLLSKSMTVWWTYGMKLVSFYFLQEKAYFCWNVCASNIIKKYWIFTVISYRHKQPLKWTGISDVVLLLPTTTMYIFNCCIHILAGLMHKSIERQVFRSTPLLFWCMWSDVDEKCQSLSLFSTNDRKWVCVMRLNQSRN